MSRRHHHRTARPTRPTRSTGAAASALLRLKAR
jgi:hypothetical protein